MHVLVMELCCPDLAAALDHAKIGWDEVLIRGLLRQLLQGVAACHNTGLALANPNPSPGLPGSSYQRCISPAIHSAVVDHLCSHAPMKCLGFPGCRLFGRLSIAVS